MPSYAKRQLQNKIPAFKHRTIGWHLQLALGEKKAITYRRYIGYSARNSTIQTLADLCAQPLCATYQQDPRVKLHYRLLSLYQQRLRFYFIQELGLHPKLENYPAFSLYSANYPSKSAPRRTKARYIAGRTLIWHLHSCFSRYEVAKIKAAWLKSREDFNKTSKFKIHYMSWATFCHIYSRPLPEFARETMNPKQRDIWLHYLVTNNLCCVYPSDWQNLESDRYNLSA